MLRPHDSTDAALPPDNSRILGPDGSLFSHQITPVDANGRTTARHAMLELPECWFDENRYHWEECFVGSSFHQTTIGCSDPRIGMRRHLGYPGLGICEKNMKIAAEKIIALIGGALHDHAVVVQSHDDCVAAHRALANHGADDSYTDEFASWWGQQLAEKVNDACGDFRVRHEHLPLREMKRSNEPMDAVYFDCTDRFNASDRLPNGPTVNLLDPGGMRFAFWTRVKHILGNGLDTHALPALTFMVQHVLDAAQRSGGCTREQPLSLFVIRKRRDGFLSNVAQKMAQDLAEEHGGTIRVIGVDERGRIHQMEEERGLRVPKGQ